MAKIKPTYVKWWVTTVYQLLTHVSGVYLNLKTMNFKDTTQKRNREYYFGERTYRNEVHPNHYLRLGVIGIIVAVVCTVAIVLIKLSLIFWEW